MKRLSSIFLIPLLLVGCAALGLSSPSSFDEQLAQAYGVHTAVASSLATAVTTGAVSVPTAVKLQAQIESARGLLDAARLAEQANNASVAQNDLTLATNALSALQTYLNSVAGTAGTSP